MENEKRLIYANALEKHIKDLPTWWADDGGVYPGGSMKYPDGMYYPEDIITSIDNAPTVDAVEVVHGRWIHCQGKSNLWYCSECGEKILYNPTRKTYNIEKRPVHKVNKYCRGCGAKMDGGNEDG